jgi:hypothetical protein
MELHHPMVRHLAWSLISPPMTSTSSAPSLDLGDQSTLNNWLISQDQQPELLELYVNGRNHRLLGSYFESLWSFFFEHYPTWQLLADHIQVHKETLHGKQQTLGELDILARSPEQNTLHVELTVKFYLQHPQHSGEELHHWIGPQTRDRLDLKLTKLSDKQFPFIEHPDTQAKLIELGLDTQIQQRAVFKGYLFHQHGQPFTLPKSVTEQALVASWCHANRAEAIMSKNANYVLLPKHDWLGAYSGKHLPVSNADEMQTEIQNHFTQSTTPYALMIAEVEQRQEEWHERQRWLVVHNGWPNSHS